MGTTLPLGNMTNGLLSGPMARLLCGLLMIAYISYLSISFLSLLFSSTFGYQVAAILCFLGYRERYLFTNLHSLVIGSDTLIVFSISLIEVSLTISVTYLAYVFYNSLMSVSSPDAVTQCLLV
jgi:hypothetical protein